MSRNEGNSFVPLNLSHETAYCCLTSLTFVLLHQPFRAIFSSPRLGFPSPYYSIPHRSRCVPTYIFTTLFRISSVINQYIYIYVMPTSRQILFHPTIGRYLGIVPRMHAIVPLYLSLSSSSSSSTTNCLQPRITTKRESKEKGQ